MPAESTVSKSTTKTAVSNTVLYVVLGLVFLSGYVVGSSLGMTNAIDATNLRMYTMEQRQNEAIRELNERHRSEIQKMIEESKLTAKELRLLQEDYTNLTAVVQANLKIEVKH